MKFLAKDLRNYIREDESPFEYVSEGRWTSEGKWEYQELIFKFEDKFYRHYNSRSGSYYTDYYRDYEDWKDDQLIECEEVIKQEVVTTQWVKAT